MKVVPVFLMIFTFSLIVFATQKDHEWIKDLTKSLDKRRPQVLIDVTLVEITRTDTFEYDLNLVANAKDAVIGNIGIDPLQTTTSKTLLEGGFNLLDVDGNPTGQTKAFYSDEKVQALLTAIKRDLVSVSQAISGRLFRNEFSSVIFCLSDFSVLLCSCISCINCWFVFDNSAVRSATLCSSSS